MSSSLYIKTKDKEADAMMTYSKPQESGYQSRMRISILRLASLSAGWLVTCALMKFGPKFLWSQASVLTWLAVGLNVCAGVGLILANKEYIEQLDELQRKIYLNALAVTVGVILIVWVPYAVMETYEMTPFHANISHLLALMGLTFPAALSYGTWRYR